MFTSLESKTAAQTWLNSFPLFNSPHSPPPAGPDIDRDAFASFDISTALNAMLRIFSNSDFVSTEPKEASYPVTGENSVQGNFVLQALL